MTKTGKVFLFTAPNGWRQFVERDRQIFHGSNNEELIVSASIIQGFGRTEALDEIRQRVFWNAEQSAKRAATHPSLTITQPFNKESQNGDLDCWSLHAQTCEGEILFYQAVFFDPRGVLIVTLEAPNTEHSIRCFSEFIRSVRVASET